MGFSQKQRADLDMNDPQQFARAMRDMGAKMGPNGEMVPTQNWGGLMGKASQQMNSLSRDARAGEGSGLGGPANTMYDRDPTFFNRGGNAGGVEGFGQMLAQTREQRIAQAQQEGTFDTIRDKYNLDNADKGMQMNKFGNLIKNAGTPQPANRPTLPNDTPGAASSAGATRPVDNALIEKRGFGSVDNALIEKRGFDSPVAKPATATATPSTQEMNRAGLQEAVAGKKLLQEMQRPLMQVESSGGDKSIQTKYGSGTSTQTGPRQGLIDGRPFSEVMQGLANKQGNLGTSRASDKFQPQQWGDILKKKAKTK